MGLLLFTLCLHISLYFPQEFNEHRRIEELVHFDYFLALIRSQLRVSPALIVRREDVETSSKPRVLDILLKKSTNSFDYTHSFIECHHKQDFDRAIGPDRRVGSRETVNDGFAFHGIDHGALNRDLHCRKISIPFFPELV